MPSHLTREEAQFIGEPAPRGLAGRLLAPQGGVVEHVDRFLLPSIAQVDYRLRPKSHLVTSTACTPGEGDTLEVFAVVTFKLPLPHWLVKPFVAPVGARIFAQDAVILGRQLDRAPLRGREVRQLGARRARPPNHPVVQAIGGGGNHHA